MQVQLIFPQTAWTTSNIGFAGISNLQKALQDKAAKLKVIREYQAVIFKIENFDDEKLKLILNALPEGYEIPALLNGNSVVVSKNGVTPCSLEDTKFQELMSQAHLEVTVGQVHAQSNQLVAEIDRMCDIFADVEGIGMPLVDFNIERLLNLISIDEPFTHKLSGILTDIKTIWFALSYDSLQAARNTSPLPDNGVMIYGLPELRGTEEELELTRRFKRYIYISNAIVRIRALWEKLIGLAVLIERPSYFDEILKAKRVRSAFIKNFQDARNPVTRYIWDYVHSVEPFEERFRTPELHKIGRVIWWTTQDKLGEETNVLLAHQNDLNRLLRGILAILYTHDESAS